MTETNPHRAGTVAILGRPNVGKSTLLNRIVGEKLAIVTPKPQTTRNRIVGVWNGPGAQIVFVDTPGVHAARSGLNRFMVSEAFQAIETVDAALLLIEASTGPARPEGFPAAAERISAAERRILDCLAEKAKPVVLALNKVDLVHDKPTLLPALQSWSAAYPFTALFPISAKRGSGVDDLVHTLCGLVPEGPPLFSPDMLTDRTERFLSAELVREQLFLRLRQELPYAVAISIDGWQERPDKGDVVIDASIHVERDSQRGIIIGKGGAMLREVGTSARQEISELLGRPAHVRLEVRVTPGWTTSPDSLERLGYRS